MLIESVQRRFTSKIHFSHEPNYWERLSLLKLMSLQRRRERYIILHLWKIMNGLISNDLNIKFSYNDRLGFRAAVPTPSGNNYKARSLFDNSIAVKGPLLFNILPKEVNCLPTLTSFKEKLDFFLQTIPDRPPVAGYVTQNNNSLLEWKLSNNA